MNFIDSTDERTTLLLMLYSSNSSYILFQLKKNFQETWFQHLFFKYGIQQDTDLSSLIFLLPLPQILDRNEFKSFLGFQSSYGTFRLFQIQEVWLHSVSTAHKHESDVCFLIKDFLLSLNFLLERRRIRHPKIYYLQIQKTEMDCGQANLSST